MEMMGDENLPPVFKSERLLPRRFKAGYSLTEEDMAVLYDLLSYHYRWLAVYEAMRAEKDRQIESLAMYAHQAITSLRAPLPGTSCKADPRKAYSPIPGLRRKLNSGSSH